MGSDAIVVIGCVPYPRGRSERWWVDLFECPYGLYKCGGKV